VQVLAASQEVDVEHSRTELAMAGEALQTAQARLRTVSSPARSEILAQQHSAVRAAMAVLATARQAGSARIATLDRTPTVEREAVAQRHLVEAQRALDTVLTRVQTTVISAPYTGVITEVLARPGMAVGPTQPVVRLAEMRTPEVVIDVDERDLVRVAVGQRATLLAEADPTRPVAARVARIGAHADTQRGVVPITLQPTEPAPWLRSGMTVDATLVLAENTRLLVVPTSAVRRQGDAASVLVVEHSRVISRQVTLGPGEAGNTVVMTGLDVDMLVVVEPAETRAGAKVKPVPRVASEGTGER
jgi:HlyD family secretion protein